MRFTLLSIVAALFFLADPSHALRSIGIITPKDAKEMSIEVRTTPSGPEAFWLELEFKPEGKLKDYQHVELEIQEGDKTLIAYAALSEKRSNDGKVTVRFMIARAFVEKVTLSIITGFPSNYSGNEIRLRDFIPPQTRQ